MKEKISASTLLTLAVSLLTIGVSLIQQGSIPAGLVCIASGAALIYAAVILVEKGIIDKMRKLR